MKVEKNKNKPKFELDIITLIGIIMVGIGIITWLTDSVISSDWTHSKTLGSQKGTNRQVPSGFIAAIGLIIIFIMNWPIKDKIDKKNANENAENKNDKI
jgi:hypothetical protein